MSNSNLPIDIQKILINSPISIVWQTITSKFFVEKWWLDSPIKQFISALDLRPGGVFRVVTKENKVDQVSEFIVIHISNGEKLILTNALTANYQPSELAYPYTLIFELVLDGNITQLSIGVLTKNQMELDNLRQLGLTLSFTRALNSIKHLSEQHHLLQLKQTSQPAQT